MLLTYAGKTVRTLTPELQSFLRYAYETGRIRLFESPLAPPVPNLAWRQPPQPPSFAIGGFYWPTDASRWAVAQFIIDADTKDELIELVFDGTTHHSKPLVMNDGTNTITTEMYMLPPLPVQVVNPDDPAVGWYILTLVDVRYYWWFKRANLTITEGVTTWTSLFSSIGTGLSETIVVDAVDTDYLKPAPSLAIANAPLPVILDAVATNVGQRIVRLFDGTVKSQSYTNGQAQYEVNLSAYVDYQHRRAGESIDTTESIASLIPATLEIVFPRKNTDGSEEPTDVYRKSYSYSDDGIGTKSFYCAAVAQFDNTADTTPTNEAELTAYVSQFATDYRQFLLAQGFHSFNGLPNWVMNTQDDYLLAEHSAEDWRTNIIRGPFNPFMLSEVLSATGTFGSSPSTSLQLDHATRKVTLTQVFGTSTKALYSDEGLELDQAIEPIWTGQRHTWTRGISVKPKTGTQNIDTTASAGAQICEFDADNYSHHYVQARNFERKMVSMRMATVGSHSSEGPIVILSNVGTHPIEFVDAYSGAVTAGYAKFFFPSTDSRFYLLPGYSVSFISRSNGWELIESWPVYNWTLLGVVGGSTVNALEVATELSWRMSISSGSGTVTIKGMRKGVHGEWVHLYNPTNEQIRFVHKASSGPTGDEQINLGSEYSVDEYTTLYPGNTFSFWYDGTNTEWMLFAPIDESRVYSWRNAHTWAHETQIELTGSYQIPSGGTTQTAWNLAGATHFLITKTGSAGDLIVQGIAAPGDIDHVYASGGGRRKIITNTTASTRIKFYNNDAGASVSNRLYIPNTSIFQLLPGQTCEFFYDNVDGKWRLYYANVPDLATSKGDLVVYESNAGVLSYVRLGVGTDGYRLTADSTTNAGVAWKADATQNLQPLFTDITDANNSGTGETDLYSHSIAGGTLGADGETIHFEFHGVTANNGNTKTIRVKFGATTIFTSPGITPANDWTIHGTIIRSGATTQRVCVHYIAAPSSAPSTFVSVDYTEPGETLSGAVTLKITGQSNTASNDITAKFGKGWKMT